MKIIEALTRIFLVLVIAGSVLSPDCFAQAAGREEKAVPSEAQAAPELKASKDKLSYALGMALGNQFRKQSIEVDPELYVRGLKDALSGGKTLLTEAEARAAVNAMQLDLKKKKTAPQGALTGMKISFQLDPRITRSTYSGDRWISPPTFIQVGLPDVKEISVPARCEGLDAQGMPLAVNPQWIPSDPGMVAVSPGQGKEVKITVKRAGQSGLEVVSQGVSKKMTVKAAYKGNAMQVEITQ
jgi:hypothetical protein